MSTHDPIIQSLKYPIPNHLIVIKPRNEKLVLEEERNGLGHPKLENNGEKNQQQNDSH
jgi:hypothetical protein